MVSKKSRTEVRVKKHNRMRNHLAGTAERPRLAVFRSNNHMYAQIIDDTVGNTLVSASTLDKEVKAELEKTVLWHIIIGIVRNCINHTITSTKLCYISILSHFLLNVYSFLKFVVNEFLCCSPKCNSEKILPINI